MKPNQTSMYYTIAQCCTYCFLYLKKTTREKNACFAHLVPATLVSRKTHFHNLGGSAVISYAENLIFHT